MISAVAFCPHPPLLVPEVAQGAASELADLRTACRAALQFAGARASSIALLGAGDRAQQHAPNARGSLAPYGVPLEIPLGSDEPGPVEMPLSLTIGAWLVRDALGPDTGATAWSVAADAGATAWPVAADAGRLPTLAGDDPVLLVVMGDGSARRSTTAPGYLDERAAGFDKQVADAMASGDPGRLGVDRGVARELLAAGAHAWNASAILLSGRSFTGDLLFDAAPYGVGYLVATWTVDG